MNQHDIEERIISIEKVAHERFDEIKKYVTDFKKQMHEIEMGLCKEIDKLNNKISELRDYYHLITERLTNNIEKISQINKDSINPIYMRLGQIERQLRIEK